jgi:asparagine N-glycosylation enzyme membrane subunit Stt3
MTELTGSGGLSSHFLTSSAFSLMKIPVIIVILIITTYAFCTTILGFQGEIYFHEVDVYYFYVIIGKGSVVAILF